MAKKRRLEPLYRDNSTYRYLASRQERLLQDGRVIPTVYEQKFKLDKEVTYGPDKPRWWWNIAMGSSATTTLLGVNFSMRGKPGFMSALPNPKSPYFNIVKGTKVTASGDLIDQAKPVAPNFAADAEASAIAASNFLDSYISVMNTWRGGNTIAEFAETVRMLGSPVKSLFKRTYSFVGGVGRLKKVYRRNPIDYGKALGDLWLGYHLGIKPTLADIRDAQKALRLLGEGYGRFDFKRVIGTGSRRVGETQVAREPVSNFPYVVRSRQQFVEYQVRYLGAVKAAPMGIGDIANEFGVGFSDIVPAVWEAVPWSFIVDYFVNVGEMLDSIKLATADFAWLQTTVRNRRVIQYGPFVVDNTSPTSDYIVRVSGGQCYVQGTSVSRAPQNSPPYPGIQFSIPNSRVKIGNIAALTAAIFRSKPT